MYQPEPAPVVQAPSWWEEGQNEEQAQAGRVLSPGRDTADQLTSNAQAEAEKIVGDARASADQMVSKRAIAETTVNEARQRADAILNDAATRSEAQLRQAQEGRHPAGRCRRKHTGERARSTSSAPSSRGAWSSCARSSASTAPG